MTTNCPIHYSLGTDKFDNAPIQKRAGDFDQFEIQILANRSPRKGTTFFCGPLSFGPHDRPAEYPAAAYYRLATHQLRRQFIALDFDGFDAPNRLEQVSNALGVFRGFGYTTWSHTDEKPRARAVLLLSREVDRSEGIGLGKAIGRWLGANFGSDAITLDKSVYQNEQPVYSPGPNAQTFHWIGDAVAVDDMLDRYPEPQKITATVRTPASNNVQANSAVGYSRLGQESLEKVLGLIDCTDEPVWFDVVNAIARAYGESGRETFVRFSRGEFWGSPYQKFDLAEVHEKFSRAIAELASRPSGFGIRHLVELAGLSFEEVEFEPDLPTSHPLDMLTVGNLGATSNLTFASTMGNGKPHQIIDNLEVVMAHNGIKAVYNQVSKQCEVFIPGLKCVLDEVKNTALLTVTDCAIKSGMTASRIAEMLDAIASKNPYCPVRQYIDSKQWDRQPRLNQFVDQIKCSNPPFAMLLWRKWLIQAVAAAYEEAGISNAGVIVLTGDQNIGKTRLFKDLTAGVQGAFLEGQTLNPADKDNVMSAVSHWVVELGELDATFRKADLAQLKAFITKNTDTLRRPYAKKDSTFPRRTVFAGTVNDFQFLHDPTGNRRFWPIDVQSISRDTKIDHQQLWAQAKFWYDQGESWYLSPAELQLLNQYSETFMVTDPEVEALLRKYPFVGCTHWKDQTITDICNHIGLEKPKRGQMMALAAAIKKHNGGRRPRESGGLKYHYVPDEYAMRQAASQATSSAISGTCGT